jgi:glycosyltransferase involved in cell wall biosynthesis
MPQSQLRFVYSAADVLSLASEREGWPNVLLESAACGTPVVAFNIGGVPEILTDRTVGTILRAEHAPAPLAAAIRDLLRSPPSRDAVRQAAVRFSWEPVLDAQLALYRRALQPAAAPRGGAGLREEARA